MMRRVNLIAGSIFLALSVFVIYLALQLPPKITGAGLGPGIIPGYLAALLGALAIILILRSILHEPDEQEVHFSREELMGLIVVFVLQIVYLASINYLGFGFATCIFVAFLSNILGKYAWWKCALLGVVFGLLSVQIFNNMLGLHLPGFMFF